jgi:hypothetical protein
LLHSSLSRRHTALAGSTQFVATESAC